MKWWMHNKKVVAIGVNPQMPFGTSVDKISPVITTFSAQICRAWTASAGEANGQPRVPMITWFVIKIMIMMMNNKAKVHE